jgi:hypothetical protein
MLEHNYIGTEHFLLGLLREDQGLAARVFESLGFTVDGLRAAVVRVAGHGETKPVAGRQVPFTPRAKRVLDVAPRVALSLRGNVVMTEHILLALVRENEGGAARVLLDLNTDPQAIRNQAIRMLPPGPESRPPTPGEPARRAGSGPSDGVDATESSQAGALFGWRSRSMALAALGATSLGRRAFSPRRGQPDGLALELLVAVALANDDPDSRTDLDQLLSALSFDADGSSPLDALLSAHLVQARDQLDDPAREDEDDEEEQSLTLTDEGAAIIQSWLKRIAPLFTRWPRERPDVDDAR